MPFPKGAVCLTVDDGWQSNVHNVVEVANRHEVPVTIFVSTTSAEEGTYWWSYVQQARQARPDPVLKKRTEKNARRKTDGHNTGTEKERCSCGRDAMTVK